MILTACCLTLDSCCKEFYCKKASCVLTARKSDSISQRAKHVGYLANGYIVKRRLNEEG